MGHFLSLFEPISPSVFRTPHGCSMSANTKGMARFCRPLNLTKSYGLKKITDQTPLEGPRDVGRSPSARTRDAKGTGGRPREDRGRPVLMPALMQPSSMVLAEKYHGQSPCLFSREVHESGRFFTLGNHLDPPDYGVNTHKMWATCLCGPRARIRASSSSLPAVPRGRSPHEPSG